MKKRIVFSILVFLSACSSGNLDVDRDIGTTSEQEPRQPQPSEVQRNDKSNDKPLCECDGTGCFCLAPGAVIVYWKGPESGPID